MHTTAYWLELNEETMTKMKLSEEDLGYALRATANVLGNVAPFYVMADPADLRTIPMIRATFSKRPTIYIYDAYPGGVGFSRKLFYVHEDLLSAAKNLIMECACTAGCPSCVGPAEETGEKGKISALKLLEILIESSKQVAEK
jgi:DEAD/DEAH box helicase domain-containing protein